MLGSITDTLRQINQDLARLLDAEAIAQICRELGHTWRNRVLTPVVTLHLVVLQILRGNTAGSHLPHLAKLKFSDSAFCQARARLPWLVFQMLLAWVSESLQPPPQRDPGLWRGHRVYLVDGSSFSMPDTPELQRHFGQPGAQKPGCGFPVAHLLALFHAGTGSLREVLAAPLRTHEMSRVALMHLKLQANDLLLGDRGFCSYAHVALILSRKLQAVLRIHQRQIVDFTPGRASAAPGVKRVQAGLPTSRWLRRLGVEDHLVEWFKPKERPEWMTEGQYAVMADSIVVRELRYRVSRAGYRTRVVTLVTTLLDPEAYPAEALAALYGQRWKVEGELRDLKQTMKMDMLRSESYDGVMKELTMFALVYNLVRAVTLEAARRQRVNPDRISFIDALRWLEAAHPGEPLARLKVNPLRTGRFEPRVVKRRPKQYPLMTKPRAELRKAMETEGTQELRA